MATEKVQTQCRRILASRPTEQNKNWAQVIEAAGHQSLDIPLLEIVKADSPDAVQKIKDKILNLAHYNGVIFVSQNAVNYAFDWIEEYWPQFPLGVELYAIGGKTAALINRRLQVFAQGKPEQAHYDADGAMNSEALLSRFKQQGIAGDKYLICRGQGGRPTLADELEQQGAYVEYCELYQRCLPAAAAEKFKLIKLHNGSDIFTVFSGETLDNLVTVLQSTKSRNWTDIPILVPGERVAEKAQSLGFSQIIVAKNATDEVMWRALKEFIA